MKIRCPKCNALYRISSKKIPPQGARATCKTCAARFEIPGGMVTAPIPAEVSETDPLAAQRAAAGVAPGTPSAPATPAAPPQPPEAPPSVPLAPMPAAPMPAAPMPAAPMPAAPTPAAPPQPVQPAAAPRPGMPQGPAPSPPAAGQPVPTRPVQAQPTPLSGPPTMPPPSAAQRAAQGQVAPAAAQGAPPQPPPPPGPPPQAPARPAAVPPNVPAGAVPRPPAPPATAQPAAAPPVAPQPPAAPPVTPQPQAPRPAPSSIAAEAPTMPPTARDAASRPPPQAAEDPLRLARQLLLHQNNLANLRQQTTDAGKVVPRYVHAGTEYEQARVREVEEQLRKANPPLQVRLKRFPDGDAGAEERVFAHFPVLLGRSTVCDWRLDSGQISQFHARLVQVGGQVGMEDLGSTNGGAIIRGGSLVHRFQPRVGGDQLTEELVPIQAGDLLYVATTRITVEELGPAVASAAGAGAADDRARR